MKNLIRSYAFLAATLLMGGIGITSCNKEKQAPSPEEEVSSFGKFFLEKLAANQPDSLLLSYPDLAAADSIVSIQSDTVTVVETSPGIYDVMIAPGVKIEVERSAEGDIKVKRSKGLFAFPAENVEYAKESGIWNDSLSDAEIAEKMKSEDFAKGMKEKWLKNNPDAVMAEFRITDWWGEGVKVSLLANGKVKTSSKIFSASKYAKEGDYYKLSVSKWNEEDLNDEALYCIIGDTAYCVGGFGTDYNGYDDYYYDKDKDRIVYTSRYKDEYIPVPSPKKLSSFKEKEAVTWLYKD